MTSLFLDKVIFSKMVDFWSLYSKIAFMDHSIEIIVAGNNYNITISSCDFRNVLYLQIYKVLVYFGQ